MATIRRGGGVQIQTRAVTTTPRSGLDSFLGFASSLARFGSAIRSLADRRNEERFAAESARANSFIDSLGDQAEALRLELGDDYTALTKGLQPLDAQVEDWIEKHAKDDRTKANVRNKWMVLKDRQQQPVLEAQSRAMSEQRERTALDVAAQFMPDPERVGRALMSPDPNVRRAAAQEMTAWHGEMTNPDGAYLQQAGPDAGAKGYVHYKRLVEKGSFMAWMDSQSDKDLPNAIKTWYVSGAPMGDGTFAGATLDGPTRRAWMNEWTTAKTAADTVRKSAETHQEKVLDAKADAWWADVLKRRGRGEVLSLDHAESAPEGDAGTKMKIKFLETRNTAYESRSPEHQQVAAVAGANLNTVVKSHGPSMPGSLGILAAERETILGRTDLHPLDQAELLETVDNAIGAVRSYDGLTLRQQQEQTALDRFNAFEVKLPAESIAIGVGEGEDEVALGASVQSLTQEGERRRDVREWFMGAVSDPTVDPRVAADIAIKALGWPAAGRGIRSGLLRAFRSPEALRSLRADPMRTLGAFPTVRTDLIDYQDGRLNLAQTSMNVRLATDWTHDDGALNTQLAATFLVETLDLELFRDPAKEMKAMEADANLDAMGRPMDEPRPAGMTNFGPGA